jgi:hypothetical protein
LWNTLTATSLENGNARVEGWKNHRKPTKSKAKTKKSKANKLFGRTGPESAEDWGVTPDRMNQFLKLLEFTDIAAFLPGNSVSSISHQYQEHIVEHFYAMLFCSKDSIIHTDTSGLPGLPGLPAKEYDDGQWFRSQAHGVIIPTEKHPESGKLFLFLPRLCADDDCQQEQCQAAQAWLRYKNKDDLTFGRLHAGSYRYGLELEQLGTSVPPFQGLNGIPFPNQEQWLMAHTVFKVKLHLHLAGLGYGYYIRHGCPHAVINTCDHLTSVAWDDYNVDEESNDDAQKTIHRPYRSITGDAKICLVCGGGSSVRDDVYGCCNYKNCHSGYHLECASRKTLIAINSEQSWTCLICEAKQSLKRSGVSASSSS